MDYYGVRGPLKGWITNFLVGRTQQVIVNGATSNEAEVLSSIPQGTVIGPLLFLMFINDITQDITSNIRLFADDCLLYRPVKDSHQQDLLQQDLTRLQEWASTWLMAFNVSKCFSMNITSPRRRKLPYTYRMDGKDLQTTPTNVYLGVTISDKMHWGPHINQMCKKANRVLGFLRRNLKNTPTTVKEKAYRSVVRPCVEYAGTVWDPHQQYLVDQVEAVQRRAARFVCNKPHYDERYRYASVTEMMDQLEWQSLQNRRYQQKVVLVHKMRQDQLAIPQHLIPTPADHRARLKCPHKLFQPRSAVDIHLYSPMISGIRLVNSLPTSVYSEDMTVDVLKAHLSSYVFPVAY